MKSRLKKPQNKAKTYEPMRNNLNSKDSPIYKHAWVYTHMYVCTYVCKDLITQLNKHF